ncbi:hypothetical protein ACIBQ1_31170 [Nonomuraea sp. NPDC050153]|uniref:hypothetical protein n=1 Tax=Nonomuraea sp. NPDC050153 TaxID=3364359 RepID=UPI0037958C86
MTDTPMKKRGPESSTSQGRQTVDAPSQLNDNSVRVTAAEVTRLHAPVANGMTTEMEEMRKLVNDLDSQHRREAQAYEQGYRDGHLSGWEVGYGHAHHEMAQEWRALAEHVRRMASRPTYAELEARRGEMPPRSHSDHVTDLRRSA